MRKHCDQRRSAYCRVFEGTPGDVNVFVVRPHQRTAWHRHQRQTDQFMVIRGSVAFQKFEQGGIRSTCTLMGPDFGVFTVEPNHWHGYSNDTDEPAYVVMYLSQPYDETDEERMPESVIPWDSRLTWEACDYCKASTRTCQCGSEKTEIDY